MRAAVIIYHKNVDDYIPAAWLEQCIESIRQQTYKKFDVWELNYGSDERKVYPESICFFAELANHALAHNWLLDEVFPYYDCAFNVNIDDYYAHNRFEQQLKFIEQGYEVVSSNFYRIFGDGNITTFEMHTKDPIKEAAKGHNIIAHPVCCYSRKFWERGDRLNPSEIPCDDFELWKRSYKRGVRFAISPDYLLYHRVHANNVSKK